MAIIFIGIVLRLVRYLHNPVFWFDESVYAVDIINRAYSDLINPSFDWNSKPPYGFLMLEKLIIQVFGYSEYSFRLFPLMSGLISVPLFYYVAKHYIKPGAVPIALGLFAVLDPLVFQSSNLKPYSGDLAFALIIFAGIIYLQSKRINLVSVIVLGVAGAVIVWFSHPSVFVLTGVATSLMLFYIKRNERETLWKMSIAFAMWAASFVVFYLMYTSKLMEGISFGTDLLMKLENAFIPLPPTSFAELRWLIDNFFETFNSPVGLSFTGVAAVTFLVGCTSIFRGNKEKFFIIISPILFTVLAAVLHKYPFKGRLIVFLVPFYLLFIAEGTEYIREKISSYSAAAGIILIGVLFVYPLSWAAYHVKNPIHYDEIRPVIEHIKENWREGDLVYVHYYPQYAFEYYTEHHPQRYVFGEDDYVIGIAPKGWYRRWRKHQVSKYYDPADQSIQSEEEILREYMKDLDKLKDRERVWFIFTSKIPKNGMNEENFFLFHLNDIGKQLESFGRPGMASGYLYDLGSVALTTE